MLMTPITLDYYRSWLGLTLLKAVDVGINTEYRGDLLVHVLNNSMAPVMTSAPEFVERVAEALPRPRPPPDDRRARARHRRARSPDPGAVAIGVPGWRRTTRRARPRPPMGHLLHPLHLGHDRPVEGSRASLGSPPTADRELPSRSWTSVRTTCTYLPTVTYHLGGKTIPYLPWRCATARPWSGSGSARTSSGTTLSATGSTSTALVGAMVPLDQRRCTAGR